MVFTTALAFSTDEKTMLTVSADASALATEVSLNRSGTTGLSMLIFGTVVVVIAAILWFFVIGKLMPGQSQTHGNQQVLPNDEL